MLTIQKTADGEKTVLTLEGRLDTVTAPEFERTLQTIMPDCQDLTLDFEALDYISSAGLRQLLAAQKQMDRQQGVMRLLHVSAAIMDVFEITGFSGILHFA